MRTRWRVVACFVALFPIGAGSAPLGTLCEASAARFVPCPKGVAVGAGDACLLVADNEISDRLFLYAAGTDGSFGAERPIPLVAEDGSRKGAKVGDIEALEVADGVVWVVGSHGRKKWSDERAAGDAKQCGVDGGRLSLFRGAWQPETVMDAIRGVRTKAKKQQWPDLLGASCRSHLFDLDPDDVRGNELAASACAAFATHDAGARANRALCASAFQIEGAALIPSARGARRLWLGLRSPVLEQKSMLLRVQEGAALRFDGIALADLGAGRGIRDLAHVAGRLWAIAGPEGESSADGFELVATEAESLESGARLALRPVGALRAQSEGLAIAADGARIVVTTDGKAPARKGGRCEIASELFQVSR